MTHDRVGIPKRATPPDEAGNYYYQNDELVQQWSSDAYHIVTVAKVNRLDLGLYGTVINVYISKLHHVPIANFPEGTWWGPLPEPITDGVRSRA